jgi:seryl-tRNA synthetase
MLTMKVMFNNAFLLPLRGSYNFKKYAKCALSSFNNLNRIPANDKSFSVNTLALNPDLLRSQLVCRKIANSEVIVENVVSLRDQRNAIIKRTDDIKHEKKLLSDQIGSLIRSDGDKDNIAKLTAQSKEMDAILVIEDTKLTEISNTLSKLVMSIPNFLDDR